MSSESQISDEHVTNNKIVWYFVILFIIYKAQTACEISEHKIFDHFVNVNTIVKIGSCETSPKNLKISFLFY